MNWINEIVLGIVMLIVGGILTTLYNFFKQRCWRIKFKSVFGNDVADSNKFRLVFGEFILSPPIITFLANNSITHPYQKPMPISQGPVNMFSISKPVSIAEVRAVNYLSSVIGKQVKQAPVITSDIEIKDKLDLSFVSFGGPNGNHKTNDVLTNEANQLINFDQGNSQMISVTSKKPILTTAALSKDYDYGLILKIHLEQPPNHVWITCAGFGEWGTSGAAYYLAKNWQKIYEWAKGNNFAIIVKVRNGQDESAEEYWKEK